MVEWWNSLSLLGQIFACIAIPSTIIMIIQVIMMFFGLSHSGDADIDGDVNVDLDGDGVPDGIYGDDVDTDGDFESDAAADSGFRLLSVRGIISFFAIFGWTGLVVLKSGGSTLLALGVAASAGFATMVILALIFMWMFRLQSDGTIDIKYALGVSGKVYLRIPPQRQGTGKVNVMLQGRYAELPAVTDETDSIQFGEEIVVIGISGSNTLVVKRK